MVEVVGVLDENLAEDVRIADAKDWGVTLKVAKHAAIPPAPLHRGLKLALCATSERVNIASRKSHGDHYSLR